MRGLPIALFSLLIITFGPVVIAQQTTMTPELLWQLGRLGESSVSESQSQIAYTVRRYDLAENSGKSTLHLLDIAAGKSRPIVEQWPSLNSVQWSTFDDQPVLYFIGIPAESDDEPADSHSADDDSDSESNEDVPQVWRYRVSDGSLQQVTEVEDGVANLKVSPSGKHIAFTIDIKMDEDVNERHPDLPKAEARVIDNLMFRHWNAWHDFKYSHLHVASIGDDGLARSTVDLMEGMRVDCPVPPFGGSEQFAWSPEGNEICYTAKIVERWAESTNSDLFIVRLNENGAKIGDAVNITQGMEGYDNDPFYSPNGKWIAFHSMQRPSFESDRNRIMLFDRQTKNISELTRGLDQNANHAMWSTDSTGVLFVSEYRGSNQIFRMDVGADSATQLTEGPFNWDLVDIGANENHLFATKTSMLRPAEIHSVSLLDKSDEQLTTVNNDIYENLALPTIGERWVDATDGKRIHCWVIYPADFDESKSYPMLTYCQGGPQGQVGQWFSYRWNFHLMAANGYVVLAPNRRGLPGFGRAWNDQISGDWGGQAMQDLLSATDNMLDEPYIDRKRVAAVGASFGGYTVYWMMGNHQDRFAAMIAHCGVFNLESMYGATEELFFVNWDLGGPYWKSRDIQRGYDQFSPHRFVRNWKTPLMVIHGERDFRVPVTQGLEAFTAAQVQNVPSRFLYFPSEGHWVLQPQNGVLWHREFFSWLDTFCK